MKTSLSKFDMCDLTRREFLALTRGIAALSVFSSPIARAFHGMTAQEAAEPHMLLHLRANGGWDVLMGMDAKDLSKLANGEGSRGLLKNPGRVPARSFSTGALGPAMSPLFPYLSDIAIINGIMSVETSSDHIVNRTYMSAGSNDAYAPYLPFLIARARGGRDRVAHRVDGSFYDGGYERKMALGELGNLSPTPSAFARAYVDGDTQTGSTDFQANLIREQTRESTIIATLGAANTKLQALGSANFSGVDMQSVRLALAGFASGYIQSAICEFSNSFDTHSEHQRRHTDAMNGVFGGIAMIIETMKNTVYQGPGADGKKTLFDLTTVVLTSDFSRTSDRDGGEDGTDHNQFCNSCILFGKGVVGGTMIGQSDIYSRGPESEKTTRLRANFFDFKAQRPLSRSEMLKVVSDYRSSRKISSGSADIDYIYPESIWWTIANGMRIKTLGGLETSPVLRGLMKS